MSYEKPKPKPTTKARQDKDKREYERLVAEIKQALEHRSPGVWDWWDTAVEAVSEWGEDALEWANDVVDDYVWDTTEEEAALEGWLQETFVVPAVKTKDAFKEAVEEINEVVDTYIWDTSGEEAIVEEWVRDTFDIPDQETKTFIEEVAEDVKDDWKDFIGKTKEDVKTGATTITSTVDTFTGEVGDIINNISFALGVGFDAAMAAIGILPSLLIEWVADFKGWFDFDIEEFTSAVSMMSEKMKATESK